MQTGARGTTHVSPRNVTGRTFQQQQAEKALKEKQAADIKAGRTYEAGFAAGRDDGWNDGFDSAWKPAFEAGENSFEAQVVAFYKAEGIGSVEAWLADMASSEA